MSSRLTMIGLVLPLMGGALVLTQPHKSAVAPPDRARLEQVLAAWSSKDVSQPAKFYARDANLVFYDIAPVKYSGFAEYEKGVGELFKTIKSISFKLNDDVQIHHEDDIAWSAATVATELVNNDGSSMKLDARWTTVWEKRGDNWVIVHDHFSAPLPEPKAP